MCDEKFDSLYSRHHQSLHAIIAKLVKNPSVVEDISQEEFAKLWQNRERLAIIEDSNAYVFRMAYNEGLTFLRRQRLTRQVTDILGAEYKEQIH